MKQTIVIVSILLTSFSTFANISIFPKEKLSRKPNSEPSYKSDGKLYYEVVKDVIKPLVLSAYNPEAETVNCIYSSSLKKDAFKDRELCISSGKLEFKNNSLMFNNLPLTYAWSIGAEGDLHESLSSLKQVEFSEIKNACKEVFNGKGCYIMVWYKAGQFDSFPNPK